MKAKLIALLLFALTAFHAAAVPIKINIQGSNIVVRWPSQNSQKFIIGYRAALDAANPWMILRTNYPASTSNETIFIVTNVVPLQNFSGGGGGGAGGPPGFNAALRSASTITSAASLTERAAVAQERRTQALKIIMPPPVRATKRQDFQARSASAASVAALAEEPAAGQSASLLSGNTVSSGFFMVSENNEDVDGDGLPSYFELGLALNPFVTDTDHDGIDDGLGDSDGDGSSNFEEWFNGTEPLVSDNTVPLPLSDGLVLSGEYTFTFSGITNSPVGEFLMADGNTADSLVSDTPAANQLRLRWNSTFVQYGGSFFATAAAATGPFLFTSEDRRLIREAFGDGGTSMSRGTVQTVNQEAVDKMRRELLEHLEQTADVRIKKSFQVIQELNLSPNVPPVELERRVQTEIAQVHTQFMRGGSVNRSLVRRFGRALNRSLPFFGGILILANASQTAQAFYNAAVDYAHDIKNGDEESGSAAIMAGTCNDLAPGSGNLVLSFLLR